MGPFDDLYNATIDLGQLSSSSSSSSSSSFSSKPKSAVGSMVLGFGLDLAKTFAQQYLNDRSTQKQNEYNSPANQMKRLREAGINPYADTSQIASANRSAEYHPAKLDFDNATMMNNLRMQEQQIMRNRLDIDNQKLQNQSLLFDNQFKSQTLRDKVAQVALRTDLANLQVMYQNRIITRTELENALTQLRSEYQSVSNQAFSSMWSYDGIHSPFDMDYWVENGGQVSPYAARIFTDIWSRYADIRIKDINQDILDNQFTASYWKALREQIAAEYEQSTGHPWNASSDVEGIYHTLAFLLKKYFQK